MLSQYIILYAASRSGSTSVPAELNKRVRGRALPGRRPSGAARVPKVRTRILEALDGEVASVSVQAPILPSNFVDSSHMTWVQRTDTDTHTVELK